MQEVRRREKQNHSEDSKRVLQKKMEKEKEKDQVMVRGMFKNYETKNGRLDFSYRKHKGEPIRQYTLYDGEVCSLPFGVAKHLNKNGWYPVHEHFMDENNKAAMRIGQKVRRFGFQSLEFTDEKDLQENTSNIVTVETTTV